MKNNILLILFMTIGIQLFALAIWFIFEQNLFIPFFGASTSVLLWVFFGKGRKARN